MEKAANDFFRQITRFGLSWLLRCLGLLLVSTICGLMLFLLTRGAPALGRELFFGTTPVWEAITGAKPVWDGLWPACAGTICLVILSVLIVLFPGIGCGIYLAEFSHKRSARFVRLSLDILAGTPSIVMGLFGFTLILFLRHTFFPSANTSLILAACCLALLILPALAITTCQALESVPSSIKLAATAMGFSKSQSIFHVLLPAARQGINAGIILAIGRAAEDTAVVMLTGAVANAGLPGGLGVKFEALSFSIFYTAAQYQSQEELVRGFGAALVLLALSGIMLALSSLVENRFRLRWQGGI